MRHILLSACAFILIPTVAAAQQTASARPRHGIGLGVEGGLSRSSLRFENAGDFVATRTGLAGGVWCEPIRFGRLAVLVAFDYVAKGVNESGGDGTLQFHYLEIPAVVRIEPLSRPVHGARLYALGGVIAGIRVGAVLDGMDVNDQYRRTDVSIVGGGGAEFGRVGAQVRSEWGLSDLILGSNLAGSFKNVSLVLLGTVRIR
jgi:outer membrane protein with beta-barrel domain